MNDSRDYHGWIFNKLYIRKSDGIQVWRAKKQGITLEGSKAEILEFIREYDNERLDWRLP